MGRKIFVTYKHGDSNVYGIGTTARDYVEDLIKAFDGVDIYKGEGNEDLSKFKDETIKTRLKDKIHDSSITIVLISPNMRELGAFEKDQWIPWEVSYSLKEIERDNKLSEPNAVLAIVLPDRGGSYSYCIEDDRECDSTSYNLPFGILRENTFNHVNLETMRNGTCHHTQEFIYRGPHSYITFATWPEFLEKKNHYLGIAIGRRNKRAKYDLFREIENDW